MYYESHNGNFCRQPKQIKKVSNLVIIGEDEIGKNYLVFIGIFHRQIRYCVPSQLTVYRQSRYSFLWSIKLLCLHVPIYH